MANKIQLKRGTKAQLPELDLAEPGYCTDSRDLYIGNSSGGNTRFPAADNIFDNVYRQAIINGNFDIWQRGISWTNPASGQFTADHFSTEYVLDGGVNPTVVHSRQQFMPAGDLPGSFYYYRIAPSAAGSGYGANSLQWITQRIEHGTRLLCGAGKKVAVSFVANSNIVGKKIGVWLRQNYGTGGSPSAAEVINGSSVTLTSTLTRYTFTFDTNTLNGKTFGTNNNDYLEIAITYQWGATLGARVGSPSLETYRGSGIINIAQVQLNQGAEALSFQPKTFYEELQACLRYYENSYNYGVLPGTATELGAIVLPPYSPTNDLSTYSVQFKAVKRVTPTVTLFAPDGTAARISIVDTGLKTTVNATANQVSDTGFRGWSAPGTANNPSASRTAFHFVADAEL